MHKIFFEREIQPHEIYDSAYNSRFVELSHQQWILINNFNF